MRWPATTPVVIGVVVAITCTSVASGQTGTVGAEEHRADPGGPQAVSRRLGTTKIPRQECDVRGGDYVAHPDPLPDDLVDCILPPQIRRLGDHATYYRARQVLASVYDYLYRAGAERPRHGLYSYVLFPVPSRRAERFLEELFKTTSYIDLTETGISYANLNIIYLPTRQSRLSVLKPIVADGSTPPASLFIGQLYDYGLAQRLLAQICAAPADVIRSTCQSDLSRGPYIFTYAYPASALSPVPPPYLVLDLSRVHERAFAEFVSAYKEQVKRDDYADRGRIDTLRLRLLSIVLTAADWIDPIKGATVELLHMASEETGPTKTAP